MQDLEAIVAKLEHELSYCCGTTCDKCKVQQILDELKKAIESK